MGKSTSFEFNICSQEGAKLLVKAWVELMQYLADVWVEARTPQGLETRCDRARVLVVHGPPGRRARCERQGFEAR